MIQRAAIRRAGVLYIGLENERHHHVIHRLTELFGLPNGPREWTQGFVDDRGNFYNRREAYAHAVSCGQLPKSNKRHGILFSEDLW